MKKIKLLLAVCFVLVLSIPVIAHASNSAVTISEVNVTGNSVNVTGETEAKAIMVQVRGTGNAIMSMMTFPVGTDGIFQGTVTGLSIQSGTTVKVYVADFEGGSWAIKEATYVSEPEPDNNGEIPIITIPTEAPTPTPESPTVTPAPTSIPEPEQDEIVEPGMVLTSVRHNATYTVITCGDESGTIGTLEYLGPRIAKRSHKVVSKVRINNVLYKVTKIADNAFRDNTKVEKIYVGKYVTEIGDRAFYKCTGLKEITFAAKRLTKLGKLIFYKDKALEKVEIRSTRLKSANVGEKIFYAVNKELKVIVPETKVSAYSKLFKNKTMTVGVTFEAIE